MLASGTKFAADHAVRMVPRRSAATAIGRQRVQNALCLVGGNAASLRIEEEWRNVYADVTSPKDSANVTSEEFVTLPAFDEDLVSDYPLSDNDLIDGVDESQGEADTEIGVETELELDTNTDLDFK